MTRYQTAIIIGVVVSVLTALLISASRRAPRVGNRHVLTYSALWKQLVRLLWLFPLVILLVAWVFCLWLIAKQSGTITGACVVMIGVFVLGSVWLVLLIGERRKLPHSMTGVLSAGVGVCGVHNFA